MKDIEVLDIQLSRAGAFTIYASDVDSFNRLLNEFTGILVTPGHPTAKIYVPRLVQRIRDTERVAFVKRVDLEVPNDRIIDALKNIGLDVVDVTRLNRKDGNAPSGTVKITFGDAQNHSTFMHTGLQVDSMHFIAEAASQITKPVQCYICLKYNHVAKYCKTKQQVCAKCGDDHRMDQCAVVNNDGVKCTNCKGNHLATSNDCSHYREQEKRMLNLVNNAGDTQERQEIRKNGAETSNQQDSKSSFCFYYPVPPNSTCLDCSHLLGTNMTNIEEHLESHDIIFFAHICGVCHKPWPSWRSTIAHYSRSNCRHSTSATPTPLTADPPSSTNVINQSTTAIEQLQDTTTKKDSAVREESEAEKLIQTIGDQSSDEMTQQLGNDGNTHSPYVIPKTQKIADVQNIDTPVNDGKQSDDEQDNGDHGISNNTRKETNVEMKETDKKYYCEFCASDGFDKKVSRSQNMRHRHLNEYNATIEVPMKKRLWTRDDMLILAELEANLTSIETINSNSALALKLPSRSREATKKRRQNYRIQDAATTESTIVNSLTIANDSINVNNNSGNHSSNDRSQRTQIGTSNESYPDIRQYIKTNIVKGRIRLCQTMCDTMTHYVNDVPNSDPVDESLIGIHQATNSVQSSQSHKDDRQTIGSKPPSAKSIAKAQKYAHYHCLFKKDKSKLASEIFDSVDNSTVKPPMFVAYEHYKKIWTIDTKNAEVTRRKASVGTYVLLAPITRDEIAWDIDQTNNKTALGSDRLPLVKIKAIARNELWCAFNIWFGYRRIPDSLKINRTVLLPKGKDNLDNIKNWRPITIASLLLRLYNKILARRMQNVFRTNSKQTGFKPGNGVGQNVALLHNLLTHVRTNKNNLFVCLLDVSKAFDSVPHESIKRALLRNGCPFDFIDLFNNQYENSYTALSYVDRSSRLIALRRGVKQGDPMSSILFNLVIDELFEILGDRFGYELDGVGSVNARAFADDIVLMSGSGLGMQQLLSETEKFLGTRDLVLNADKCIPIYLRKAGKVKKS
ncbi:unnamed protein product [Adineta steineri]|uniref:Reverse transcriptase domain-containing protein n=1 Tax=Adineta steineri TaxID=433720 RepID=A0A819B9F7_9BILA|nr:unnamed protein product [Adineta steineri]CAF3798253.1 unnamed protein product [Adineta steineri]